MHVFRLIFWLRCVLGQMRSAYHCELSYDYVSITVLGINLLIFTYTAVIVYNNILDLVYDQFFSRFPKILKGLIVIMIYATHGLNFWVPFNIIFYYLKKRHSRRVLMWELIYRAIFVILICLIAIIFPNINALMGFVSINC